MIISRFLILTLIGLPIGLLGQFSQALDIGNIYEERFAIKYSPLPLISTTPAIQFAAEAKTFPNQGFQIEYGYVSNFNDLATNDFEGFKLKTEYRFYSNRTKTTRKFNEKRYFIGVQYFRKEVITSGMASIFRFNRSYQQIMPLEAYNETNSFFLVLGWVRKIAGSFYLETAFGLGGKDLKIIVDGIPEDGELGADVFNDTTLFDLENGKGHIGTLDAFISIKINYAFSLEQQ